MPLEEMRGGRRIFMWLHLILCRGCRAYQRQTIFVNKAFSIYRERIEDLSAQTLSRDARDRIQAELKKAQGFGEFS